MTEEYTECHVSIFAQKESNKNTFNRNNQDEYHLTVNTKLVCY